MHLQTSNSQSFPPPWQPRVCNYFYWLQSALESVPYIEHKGRTQNVRNFFFLILYFTSYHPPLLKLPRLLSWRSIWQWQALGLTLGCLIHFEFIFVFGVRECSNFILLHVSVAVFPASLIEETIFYPLHSYIFASFVID